MSCAQFKEILPYLTALGGIIAFAWGIYIYKKQMNAQMFIEYTKRFEKLMDDFGSDWPNRITPHTKVTKRTEEEMRKIRLNVLKYLNLCSEQYFLWNHGYLSRRIWRIWRSELERTLGSNLFRTEWMTLRAEFGSYPMFRSFVDQCTKWPETGTKIPGDLTA